MALKKPDAILFDWDDTVITAWHIIHAAINKTLVEMGSKAWTEAEARDRIGPPAKVLFTGLFGEENWKKADDIYIAAYQDFIKDKLKVHEGAEDVLKKANESGIYCAVVSTKRGPVLRKEIETLGFGKYFAKVVGAGDTGDVAQDKPSKSSVLRSLEGSGLSPEKHNIWFVGDGISDLECARNSGCKAILVETKLPSEDKLAVFDIMARFKNINELKPCIENFGKKSVFTSVRKNISKLFF